MKTVSSQQQESQQTPSTRSMKKIKSRHIKIKLIKMSDRKNFKATKPKIF